MRFRIAGRPSQITLGDRALEASRWDVAARYYRKVLQRNPRNPPIWVQYGHALKESGNLTEAESAYRRALDYAPKVADSHLQLGRALMLQGRDEEAQAAYLRAFDLDPSLADPLAELVMLGWPETEISEPCGRLDVGRDPSDNTGPYAAKSINDAPARLSPRQHHAKHPEHERRGSVEHQIRPRRVFDAKWYLKTYPDVAIARRRPAEHYLNTGQPEGRRPHPFFDTDFYRRRHKEDKIAQANPLGHYLAHGQEAGYDPNPFFDNGWYAARQTLEGRESALEHFIAEGEAAGAAPHPLWDEARYLALNGDIARVKMLGEFKSGYRHFVEHGASEVEAGAYRHFNFKWGTHGLDYDAAAYLATNSDAAAAIADGLFRSGIEHLFVVGFREALDGLRAIYGPRHAVRLLHDLPGEAPAGGRYLCLFAHYDRDGVVDPCVITYLNALRRQDVDIVFITATAPGQQLDKVRPLVRRILIKNDAGRDFGSWYLALKTLGVECGADYTRLIFVNDSIYCPVRPLEPLFVDMARKGYNLFGLSDSRELRQYHVQSFFLAFDRAAQEKVLPEFVARFERHYLLTKSGQIREFELGLTELAQKAGLSVGAYFSVDDAREDIIRDLSLRKWDGMVRDGVDHVNPTHDLWDLLIARYGFPGLKLELLRDNPKNATGFEALPKLIADGDVRINDIHRHQARSKAPPAVIVRAPPIQAPLSVELLKRIPGTGARKAKRCVLFAHYDPDGVIDDHIVFQVQGLARAGCAIVFVTATAEPGELDKVIPFVRDILVKNDVGRDFGSWHLAVRTLKDEFDDFGWVIWMNDSTYFPLFDPTPMFEEMEKRNLDFWGIVDSNNGTWHIMSWFWAFGRRTISDGWFDWYLDQYNSAHSKWAQIHNYELRLPRLIKQSGLKAEAYIAAEDVQERILGAYRRHPRLDGAQRGDFNMAHDFWEEIITDFRCPALKVELVRDNPLRINLSTLLDVIERETDYDPDLIRRHLLRLKAKHLPPPSPAELGIVNH